MRKSLLCLILLLGACAGGKVVVNLDIYSFLDQRDLDTTYAADVPAGLGYTPLLTLVPPTRVDLVEGLGSATLLEEGVLRLSGSIISVEGAADARLQLHLGADFAEAAASTRPVLEVEVAIEPATTTDFQGSIHLDEATLDLFRADAVWVRIDAQARVTGPLGTFEHMEGEAALTDVSARLVGSEDLLRP